jgi:circadian clock protein KaiC
MPKKISKKKGERITSGISNLDKLIEGGFEKQSINLLIGTSGSGKTIGAIQYILEGLKRNEPGLFVTFEEEKEDFYKNMLKFGWDLEAYEKRGTFTFLEYNPEKVRTMLEEGGGAIENVILKNKISRVAIDSMSSFMLLFNNELERREATLKLFRMIRNWKCTTLLTYEADPFAKEKLENSDIEFETDSVILLYLLLKKNQRKRYLEILKMRGTKHATKIYPCEIKKEGLSVGKKPISGALK